MDIILSDAEGKKRKALFQREWTRLKAIQSSLPRDNPESPVRTGVFRDKEIEWHIKCKQGGNAMNSSRALSVGAFF